jgi:heme-degrading monooxygenase HmoA
MYLRFVRMKIKDDKLWDTQRFYEERVLPQLEGIDGCLFASLLQGTIHNRDYVSMTVWQSPEAAAEYEKSGLFDRLLDEGDDLFQEAAEWATDLPGAGEAVVFTGIDPEVETWDVASTVDEDVLERVGDNKVFVRMVAVRLRRGSFEEFERRYEEEVQPSLAETPGCLGAFLVAGAGDASRVLSVTLWDREEDAVRYGLSGEFERLTARLKDTFSDLYQWKIALSDDVSPRSGSSGRGLDIERYHLVIGRKLK